MTGTSDGASSTLEFDRGMATAADGVVVNDSDVRDEAEAEDEDEDAAEEEEEGAGAEVGGDKAKVIER